MYRIFFYIVVFSAFISAKAQENYKYFRVVDTAHASVENAFANTLGIGIGYFSNDSGIISIPHDSVVKHVKFIVTAPGYNPKLVNVATLANHSYVILDKYIEAELTEDNRLAGFRVMKSVFLKDYSKFNSTTTGLIQKRRLNLYEVPIEIKGVSGRLVPSIKDSGLVLTSLRWSDIDYTDVNYYQERIYSRLDSGLFKKMGEMSSFDFLRTIRPPSFYLNPLSNLEYADPIHATNSLLYYYYLVDSIEFNNSKLYRIQIEPTKKYSSLFKGNMWVDVNSGLVIELHIRLSKQNHISYSDSLKLHFYSNPFCNRQDGNAQHTEVWLNILGYKFKLNVNSLAIKSVGGSIDFNKKMRVVEKDYLPIDTLKFFDIFINGNKNILEDLESKKTPEQDKKGANKPVGIAKAFFFTGATYDVGKGSIEMIPFFLTNGFNTVEGWYINYWSIYHLQKKDSYLKIIPNLRYGFALKRIMPKIEIDYEFKLYDPIKVVLEGGRIVQQFNPLNPINPGINMLYSLGLGTNYLKVYQKDYLKFKFDKEILKGLEVLLSFEISKRSPLFNNSDFTLFGVGDKYTPNNIDRAPEINPKTGFESHFANILELQLYYQFGRRYDFVGNKLKKLNSNLPRVSFVYRKGFGYNEGMPDFNYLRFGVGSKTRIKDVGIFEADFVFGGFINPLHIEFVDFQHFSGVQTAFLNYSYDGWTDVRQFSTLPYYDYSTKQGFVEMHLKHRFLGWLMSKPKIIRKFTLQTYVGYNFLYTTELGAYNELYFGYENILRVFNIQLAAGIDRESQFHTTILFGVNFDFTFYINSKKRK